MCGLAGKREKAFDVEQTGISTFDAVKNVLPVGEHSISLNPRQLEFSFLENVSELSRHSAIDISFGDDKSRFVTRWKSEFERFSLIQVD